MAAKSREEYLKVLDGSVLVHLIVSSLTFKLSDLHYIIIFFFFLIPLQLKNKLQILTVGIGGVGLASAYVSYSPQIAVRQEHSVVLSNS